MKKIQYAALFNWHFCYPHVIDDQNNLCHVIPSIEDTWIMTQWECQVFAFLLSLAEVNAFMCLQYFLHSDGTTLLSVCHILAWQIINKPCIQQYPLATSTT